MTMTREAKLEIPIDVAKEVEAIESEFRALVKADELRPTFTDAYDFLDGWMKAYRFVKWHHVPQESWITQAQWEQIQNEGRERLYNIVVDLNPGATS